MRVRRVVWAWSTEGRDSTQQIEEKNICRCVRKDFFCFLSANFGLFLIYQPSLVFAIRFREEIIVEPTEISNLLHNTMSRDPPGDMYVLPWFQDRRFAGLPLSHSSLFPLPSSPTLFCCCFCHSYTTHFFSLLTSLLTLVHRRRHHHVSFRF